MPNNPIQEIYTLLFSFFGPQEWWPGDTPFEVMVGAVLTQNTSWTNVEKALAPMKENGLLSFAALESMPHAVLAEKIRPCGYYNLKATRLQNLFSLIRTDYNGDLDYFLNEETNALRQALLSVKGIGPETADSILLYAANKPVFVVDAYTHRVLARHGIIAEDEGDYHQIQGIFLDSLPLDIRLFNEYHALLVQTGKNFCKKSTPKCPKCPLAPLLA
jgi:endonuclease-3 related protein